MPTTKLQNSLDFEGQKFYIGINVHKKSWSVSVRSLNLQLEHFSQPSVKLLINHLQKKYPGGEYYSAYEAGFSGTGIHEQLCSVGVRNIVVHPADIPSTDKQNKNSQTFATAGPLLSIWRKAICTGYISCPGPRKN